MYVQHPYKYEGKYYAKIDGIFYEISKEVAMAMFAEYRNLAFRNSSSLNLFILMTYCGMGFLRRNKKWVQSIFFK